MIFLQYSIMILQYSSITIHQKESIDRMSEIKLNNILQKKKKKKRKEKKKTVTISLPMKKSLS